MSNFLRAVLDWIRRLACEDHGLCVLHNLFARERRFQHVPPAQMTQFFQELKRIVDDEGYHFEPRTMIDRIGDESSSLLLAGPPVSTTTTVSRFLTTADIVDHYGGALGLPIGRDRSDRVVALRIQSKSLTARHLSGLWRGSRPMCWVTDAAAADAIQRTATANDDYATSIRDVLGKKGWEDTHVHIVRVDYHCSLLPASSLRTPTIMDGGGCTYFRPHDELDGWGRSIDLRTLGPGLPEAVHAPIDVDPAFSLTYCGPIRAYSPGFAFRALLAQSKAMLR